MLSQEIIKKIKQIEIHTKRLLSGSLVGDYSSARKGAGFEFDQIREYQVGDDVRFIDWNSTAKMNKLLVKQYIEERNRNVIIAVDISSSNLFSSSLVNKFDVMTRVAAVLSLVAEYGKDHASLILFSDEVELVIPPGRGSKHIHSIMKSLFTCRFENKKTDIKSVLNCLSQMKFKDAIVFLISDFIDEDFKKSLKIVSKKYDVVAIRCIDENEKKIPNVGFLTVNDIETGKSFVLDTRNHKVDCLSSYLKKRLSSQSQLFKKLGIDFIEVEPGKPFIGDLIKFFRRRMMY